MYTRFLPVQPPPSPRAAAAQGKNLHSGKLGQLGGRRVAGGGIEAAGRAGDGARRGLGEDRGGGAGSRERARERATKCEHVSVRERHGSL